MPRKPKPDLDERFSLPEDTDPDDVLRRLLGVENEGEDVSADPDEDDSED